MPSKNPSILHEIYRFFSLVSIFVLILLNYPGWFKNILSTFQIISWLLLIISLIIAIWGFYQLYIFRKPEKQIENTTILIKTGLYKYIRHPLYLSLISGSFGVFLKDLGIIQFLLVATNIISLTFTAKIEEKEMIKKFGSDYLNYMNNSKIFIPYIL